jgi:hypothetical protein
MLPDVPAVAESGYKNYDAEVRLWLCAPAKMGKASDLPACRLVYHRNAGT